MNLAELFPDEDYRFQMRFERAPARDFFRPTDRHDDLIAQRRHWLSADATRYSALLPQGLPLVEEAIEFARAETSITLEPHPEPLLALGQSWEPDILLLKLDSENQMRLLAGCVCFPSSWDLAEKIGQPIEAIHGVVPGLNAAIGKQIHTFLAKLRPGTAWLRANWGLSRSPELNQHPHRKLPPLDASVRLEEIWLRIEHQALVALPRTGGVLFGIRLGIHPLAEIRAQPALAQRLSRALQTMPAPMAQYKNLAPTRQRVIALLEKTV